MSEIKNGRYRDVDCFLWFKNDQLHREDGPAVEADDGTKKWFMGGQLHREDGPAYEHAKGTKEWWIHDQLHREEGPAVEWPDDSKEWWLNGVELSEEEFKQWLEKKELNEKLHTTLAPKPMIKRSKI
ncbi:hypothetical protein [Ralstonia pseudosolanacearum]